MNKKELIEEVSKITLTSKETVNAVICSAINIIVMNMSQDKDVFLRNFATFTTKIKKAKKGHNFAKGTTIDIPSKRIPIVKFAKNLKEWINDSQI